MRWPLQTCSVYIVVGHQRIRLRFISVGLFSDNGAYITTIRTVCPNMKSATHPIVWGRLSHVRPNKDHTHIYVQEHVFCILLCFSAECRDVASHDTIHIHHFYRTASEHSQQLASAHLLWRINRCAWALMAFTLSATAVTSASASVCFWMRSWTPVKCFP